MSICAVVDANNVVVNIIVAEPTDVSPDGCTLVPLLYCNIGDIWDGKKFNPPVGS